MLLWNFRHALKFSFCFWLRWLKKNCLQCRRPRSDPWVRKTPWRRKRHPAPVPLPGEFHGQRSLVGYSLWDCKESETTDWQTHFTWGKQLPWGELGAILLKGEDTWRERHWRTRQNESREAADRWGKHLGSSSPADGSAECCCWSEGANATWKCLHTEPSPNSWPRETWMVINGWGLPCGPMAKTLYSQCRGPEFDPCSGN